MILQYSQDIKAMDSYVAEVRGRIAGFITIKQHNPHTAEIQVMAVREDHHRCQHVA